MASSRRNERELILARVLCSLVSSFLTTLFCADGEIKDMEESDACGMNLWGELPGFDACSVFALALGPRSLTLASLYNSQISRLAMDGTRSCCSTSREARRRLPSWRGSSDLWRRMEESLLARLAAGS